MVTCHQIMQDLQTYTEILNVNDCTENRFKYKNNVLKKVSPFHNSVFCLIKTTLWGNLSHSPIIRPLCSVQDFKFYSKKNKTKQNTNSMTYT